MHLTRSSQSPRPCGFSLIELMIAVVIFAFLILLAGPMYTDFIANSRVRNAGESVLNGVRMAQSQAVKNNNNAWFVIDPATGWSVFSSDDDADCAGSLVTNYVFSDSGAAKTTVTTASGNTMVTFDGLGRIRANRDGACAVQPIADSLAQVDITSSYLATARNLRVVISAVGGSAGTKLCDPGISAAVSPNDPALCP